MKGLPYHGLPSRNRIRCHPPVLHLREVPEIDGRSGQALPKVRRFQIQQEYSSTVRHPTQTVSRVRLYCRI